MADNDQEEKKFRFRNLFRSRPSVFKRERYVRADETGWDVVELVIGKLLGWTGGLMMFGGLAILAWQAAFWWYTAEWTPYPLMVLLDTPPEIQAKGAAKIVEWLLDMPLSSTLIVVGAVVALIPHYMEED